MSHNVLILSTSPRRGGNSDLLCGAVARGAEAVGKSVKKLRVGDMSIAPCRACDACRSTGLCVQRDDMAEIVEAMRWAEAVVFATPIYFYNMSAQLKTLIDRTYSCQRSFTFSKAALIAVCADKDESTFANAVSGFNAYLGCLDRAENAGQLLVSGVFDKGLVTPEAMAKAERLGRTI